MSAYQLTDQQLRVIRDAQITVQLQDTTTWQDTDILLGIIAMLGLYPYPWETSLTAPDTAAPVTAAVNYTRNPQMGDDIRVADAYEDMRGRLVGYTYSLSGKTVKAINQLFGKYSVYFGNGDSEIMHAGDLLTIAWQPKQPAPKPALDADPDPTLPLAEIDAARKAEGYTELTYKQERLLAEISNNDACIRFSMGEAHYTTGLVHKSVNVKDAEALAGMGYIASIGDLLKTHKITPEGRKALKAAFETIDSNGVWSDTTSKAEAQPRRSRRR